MTLQYICIVGLKCVVVEDSWIEREAMVEMCKADSRLDVVNDFERITEAVNYINKFPVDLIISDIVLEDGKGFELTDKINATPLFIFNSSHKEFAVEAFNVNAVDYISKPINSERFTQAVNKAIEIYKNRHEDSITEKLQIENNFFYIKESSNYIKININDLMFIESLGNFTRLYLSNGKRHVTLVGLKYLEVQLPVNFYRIHRTFIVNEQYIDGIASDEIIIKDHQIPIGKTYKEGFLQNVISKKLIR